MCIMNLTSKYLINVTLLRFLRVVVITLWINICNQCTLTDGKVFERCELAQLLRYGHGVDVNEVANWVCIAQHSSSLNTSAFGGTELSGSHGLFQISDEYWCSPPGKGVACGVKCDRLRDDDISDDFACVKKIHDEHQRLSGDGFNAWIAYQTFCKDNPYEYIEECFGEEEQEYLHSKSKTVATEIDNDEEENNDTAPTGKVYERCELAKELLFKHMLPMDQISTWVCIAHRESNYNTSVVGRLNADGSRDHGLFQISDLFWCSHKGGSRKACGVHCSKFLDSDITDDVNCVKQIHKEHTKLFGDGFNAWAVHKPFCQDIQARYVLGCFDDIETNGSKSSETTSLEPISDSTTPFNIASTTHKPPTMFGFEQNSSEKNGSTPSTTLFWPTLTTSKPTKTTTTNIPFWDTATLKPSITTLIPFWKTSTTTRPFWIGSIATSGKKENYDPLLRRKVYARCDLPKELFLKHKIPIDEIPSLVCIALRESNYNTPVAGRLNFNYRQNYDQVNDLFWCLQKGGTRKTCGMPCYNLLNSDVNCVKQIHKDQTFCQDTYAKHIHGCFDGIDTEFLKSSEKKQFRPITHHTYSSNAFLKPYAPLISSAELKRYSDSIRLSSRKSEDVSKVVYVNSGYSNNPFLKEALSKIAQATTSSTPGAEKAFAWSIPLEYSKQSYQSTNGEKASSKSTTTDAKAFAWSIPSEYSLQSSRLYDEEKVNNAPTPAAGKVFVLSKPSPTNSLQPYKPKDEERAKHEFFKALSTPSQPVFNISPRINRLWPHKLNTLKTFYTSPTPSSQTSSTTTQTNRFKFRQWSTEESTTEPTRLLVLTTNKTTSSTTPILVTTTSLSVTPTHLTSMTKKQKTTASTETPVSKSSIAENQGTTSAALELITLSVMTTTPIPSTLTIAPKLTTANSVEVDEEENDGVGPRGKVFERCELAREFLVKHKLPMDQISTWVCIAHRESNYNTSVVGRLNADGSNDHGLFQISDLFWCSHKGGSRKACGVSCSKFLDSDITDDVECVKKIHEEHTGISGDGFNAWAVYKPYCQGSTSQYLRGCFDESDSNLLETTILQSISDSTTLVSTTNPTTTTESPLQQNQSNTSPSSLEASTSPSQNQSTTSIPFGLTFANLEPTTLSLMSTTPFPSGSTIGAKPTTTNSIQDDEEENNNAGSRGKVYGRCELAREFLVKHKLPMDQISTWVCIAHRESNYNTSVVGRLNADGSNDHGLFQISDLFWCSHKGGTRKACGVSCSKFLDSDITDDVECVKKIHDEHTGISGDGFNAWAVYKPYCQGSTSQYIRGCFDESDSNLLETTIVESISDSTTIPPTTTTSRMQQNRSETSSLEASSSPSILLTSPRATTLQLNSSTFTTSTTKVNQNQITAAQTATEKITTKASAEIPLLLSSTPQNQSTTSVPFGQTFSNLEPTTLSLMSTTPFSSGSTIEPKPTIANSVEADEEENDGVGARGKVFERCELAREFLVKHKLPMDQISTWVCIAHRESNYNTSVVGRLNADGSNDHGLFQISDLFWCSHKGGSRKACGVSCSKFLDSDITDDVECVKKIHEEHTGISGDGFNAWAVYKPYCQGSTSQYLRGCFDESDSNLLETTILQSISDSTTLVSTTNPTTTTESPLQQNQSNTSPSSLEASTSPSQNQSTTSIPFGLTFANLEPTTLSLMSTTPFPSGSTIGAKPTTTNSIQDDEEENNNAGSRGKVYGRCELAREFLVKHKLPMDQISTWVCIAHRESNYNTSVVGRLNADGSNDHGLFQISDLFWCSHKGGTRKACGVSCSKFLDSDITDDVECVKKIHDEHTGISGDGFNAWAVYKPYCQGSTSQYIRGCFDESDSNLLETTIVESISDSTTIPPTTTASRMQQNRSETSSLEASSSPSILLTSPRATTLQLNSSTFTTSTTKVNQNQITAAQTATEKITTKASAEIPLLLSSTPQNQSTTSVPFGQTFSNLEPTTLSLMSTTPFSSGSTIEPKPTIANSVEADEEENDGVGARGKVFERCELAREFLVKHKLPMDQISTWVCIAHRESNYNTSVVGRLNADGSNDHGLFQISDLFWCSHKGGTRKACGVSCSKFLDSDITDDVECVKKIHDEHTGISGDGFNAWAVYKPYCQGSTSQYLRGCFDESDIENSKSLNTTVLEPIPGSTANPFKATTSVSLQNQTESFLVSTSPTTPLGLLTAAPIQHESLAATSTTTTKTTGKTTSVVKSQKMPTQVKMNTRKPLNCTGSAKLKLGTGKTSVRPSFEWSFPSNK